MTDGSITLGALVAERAERSRIFEELGFDYCCGGKQSLAEACNNRGLDMAQVLERLNAVTPEAGTIDAAQLSLTELVDHIEQSHHAFLRTEMPRLMQLAAKVDNAHAANHPEVSELHRSVGLLCADLEQHLMKEEMILFPFVREMDGSRTPLHFHCGSVSSPINQMEHEHDVAGEMLAHLREITADYTVPAACATFRALYDSLQTLERDLHQHIHKENNILFPKVIELEAATN